MKSAEDSTASKFKVMGAIKMWREKAMNGGNPSRMNSQTLQTIQESMLSQNGSGCSTTQPNKIVINVGGIKFETYKSTLRNLPDTRLAWLTETKSDNPDFDPITGEYFFDRHPNMFLMILNYYRTGKLHVPSDICGPAFEDELAFWGIDEKQIESCCWGTYSQHRDAQMTLEELKLDTQSHVDLLIDDSNFGSTAEKFGISEEKYEKPTGWKKWQPIIWSILDDHMTNRKSKIFTAISLLFTLTTIITFMLETHPCCRVWLNSSLEAEPYTSMTAYEYRINSYPSIEIRYIESICMVQLTLELLARFIFCPLKGVMIRSGTFWVDLIAVLSFYASIVVYSSVSPAEQFGAGFIALNLVRFTRVIRIMNLAKHLSGFKILLHTLKASAMELLLMFIIIISVGTLFASLLFYAEQIQEDPSNHFYSIPHGLWWAIVTMTTLGYGDKVPKTLLGYIIGSCCAIFGVMLIALPIPIIVNNFSIYYTHAKAQEKLPRKKRKNILVGAADALKQNPLEVQETTRCETISETSSTCSSVASSPTTKPTGNGWHNIIYSDNNSNDNNEANSPGERQLSRGISVTFTDSEEKATNRSPATISTISDKIPNADVAEKNLDQNKRTWPPVNGSLTKSISSMSSPALHRRPSLLPGGVTNASAATAPHQLSHRTSLSVRAADPRERRRSLLPSASGYL